MSLVIQKTKFPFEEGQKVELVARTLQGLEEELADELRALGAEDVEPGRRAVTFRGDLDLIYKVNLASRLSLKILIPWFKFKAKSPEELYAHAIGLPFSEFMGLKDTFAIDATVHSSYFNHSKYAALKFKDAIADHFAKLYGRRPNVDVKTPHYRFNVFIREADITILIDSSGASLHKRGYRIHSGQAPLNEVLAAGMLVKAGYDGSQDLLDPMCGSGTILAEALLIATKQIPQAMRDYFCFKHWPGYDEGRFKTIRRELMLPVQPPEHAIEGSDLNPLQLKAAEFNLEELKYGEHVKISQKDFFEMNGEGREGLIVMNPPYGERLELQEAVGFYDKIGTAFKHSWPGWKAWVISSHTSALKRLGLRPFSKQTLFNGPLECRYNGYEMFKGTMKEKKTQEADQ